MRLERSRDTLCSQLGEELGPGIFALVVNNNAWNTTGIGFLLVWKVLHGVYLDSSCFFVLLEKHCMEFGSAGVQLFMEAAALTSLLFPNEGGTNIRS